MGFRQICKRVSAASARQGLRCHQMQAGWQCLWWGWCSTCGRLAGIARCTWLRPALVDITMKQLVTSKHAVKDFRPQRRAIHGVPAPLVELRVVGSTAVVGCWTQFHHSC
jgi:hypothetical protein